MSRVWVLIGLCWVCLIASQFAGVNQALSGVGLGFALSAMVLLVAEMGGRS